MSFIDLTPVELKQIRRELVLTQRQLAALLDVPFETYRKYEQGRRSIPPDLYHRFSLLMRRRNEHQFEASVDWLKIRFKTLDYKLVISEVLQMKLSDFYESSTTFYGYEDMVTIGDIRVLFSHDVKKLEEGTLIELTGQGCRAFEAILLRQKRTWQSFFNDVLQFAQTHREHQSLEDYLSITRFDIALDELYRDDGSNIDLIDFANRIKNDTIIVKTVKKVTFNEGLERIRGQFKNSGYTIYFGARQSSVYIRFYQKDYEQSVARDVPVQYIRDVLGLKNRYELELHNEKALQVLMDVTNGYDLGTLGCHILNNYLEVYTPDGKLDQKWQELLGVYGGYRFVTKPKAYNYARSKKWMQKSGSGALLTMSFEGILINRDPLKEMLLEAIPNENQERTMRQMADRYGKDYEEVLKRARQSV